MEMQEVAELLVYVVLTMLAADKVWALFGGKPKQAKGDGDGDLNSALHDLDKMRREKVEHKLDNLLHYVKENREDIKALRSENIKAHAISLEKMRDHFEHPKG